MPLIGNLDTVNQDGDGVFRGWVCDPDAPQAIKNILIFRDDNYIGRTVTGTEARPDAAAYCGGSADAGWRFSIPIEEYDGVTSSWSAKIEAPDNAELDYPATWGITSVPATLPAISTIDYIAPYCFLEDASKGIVGRPGSRLDALVSFWNFNTKINGVPPLKHVTVYDAGIYTGVKTAPFETYLQRGDDRSSGSVEADIATGRSVLQRYCRAAGIMVNSYWLDDVPGEKGGQHGIVWSFKDDRKLNIAPTLRKILADYQPGRVNAAAAVRRPFATGPSSSLVFEGDIKIPWFYAVEQPDASGQGNYYVYFWDTQSGNSIAIAINLWDSRHESEWDHDHRVRFDGVTWYASQSISDPSGLRYATPEAGSWKSALPKPEDRRFASAERYRVRLTTDNMMNVIGDIRRNGSLPLSLKLRDYVLTDAIFGTEVNGRMSLGASISNFSVYANRAMD